MYEQQEWDYWAAGGILGQDLDIVELSKFWKDLDKEQYMDVIHPFEFTEETKFHSKAKIKRVVKFSKKRIRTIEKDIKCFELAVER